MASQNNVNYAGFWYRLSAYFWDSLILGIPLVILQFGLGLIFPPLTNLLFLVYAVVVIYFEGILGATPGKMILGLEIQKDDGNFIGYPMAILRYIGKIISALILGIGYLMIIWDSKKQGLHDKIAGSYVVQKEERKGLMITGLVIGGVIILAIIFMLVLLITMSASGPYL